MQKWRYLKWDTAISLLENAKDYVNLENYRFCTQVVTTLTAATTLVLAIRMLLALAINLMFNIIEGLPLEKSSVPIAPYYLSLYTIL